MLNNNICKFFVAIAIPVLAAGCETVHKVQTGDDNMSCEQLRAELGIKVEKFDDSEKKSKIGLGVTAGGIGVAFLAPVAVFAAPILLPVVLIGGTSYAGAKGINAYDNKERIAHLTDIYNKKGCASYATASAQTKTKQVTRDKELIKVQKALSEKGYEPGVADGIFGKKTQTALENYQKDNSLTVTGKADTATKNLLLNHMPTEMKPVANNPEPILAESSALESSSMSD